MNFDFFSNPSIVNNLNLGNRVSIISLNMMETGTYNPLFSRSYTVNSNVSVVSDAIGNISDRISNSALNVTPELITGLSTNLLVQDPNATQMLSIPNGWDTKRFRFNMRVKVDLTSGLTEMYDIQGFTEELAVSHAQSLDPNMKFFINSIARVSEYQDQFGQTALSCFGTSQVINGAIASTPNSTGVFTMRPKDVLGEMQWQYLSQDAGQKYIDGRANITGRSTGSSRNNCIAANYLSDTIGNWINTAKENEIADDNAIVTGTLNKLHENFFEENKFIRELVNVQGPGSSGFFTLNTLNKLDVTFDQQSALLTNRLNVMMTGGMTNHDLITIGSGSQWNGRDIEAVWASTIVQSVPAIMTKHFVGKLAFTATNKTINGTTVVTIVKMLSPNAANMNQFTSSQISKAIEVLLFKDITQDNLIKFNISAEFDIYGDTRVDVGVENRPVQTFFMPTFADSISTPVITNNKGNLTNMASSLEGVVRTITDNVLSVGFNDTISVNI